MDSDVEALVWERASQVYADSLSLILSEALLGYKRTAGFDDLTRLYEATLGGETLMSLRNALKLRWPTSDVGCFSPFGQHQRSLWSVITVSVDTHVSQVARHGFYVIHTVNQDAHRAQ